MLTRHLGGSNRAVKKLKIERAMGPWISMALLDGGMQQQRLDGHRISICAGDAGDLPSTESVCGDDSLNVWVGHILRHPGSNAGHGLLESRGPPGVRAYRNMMTLFLTDQAARAAPITAVLM